MLPERLCNAAREAVESCWGVCAVFSGSIPQSLGEHCTASQAGMHSLPSSIAQSPQQHCRVSLAVLDSLPAALYSLPCNAAGETMQCFRGD